MQKKPLMVSGIIFLVVGMLHAWRYVLKVPVAFGATSIPLWLSVMLPISQWAKSVELSSILG